MAEKDATATPLQDSYTAKDLAVLEGLDAVRKRPGMYIGSTDSRGLMHCLWEIIDNSVDESLAGHLNQMVLLKSMMMVAEFQLIKNQRQV